MDSRIPEDLKIFIVECIETVSQLELLFVIFQNKPKLWTSESISKELRTHPAMAGKQMEILVQKGILGHQDEQYFYSPQDKIIDQKVEKLFQLYLEKPVAVVTYIFTKPEERLKGFADAFKIKKD
ncbi:MAG: hypothetical protein H0V66_09335 [Bdellovibrionales bacterium]|nr:hypothetical protein [Bdellovibrionales bacterium]